MSTRLILIELEEPSTADGIAKAVSVWELPTAEELGRAALEGFHSETGISIVEILGDPRIEKIGEIILARLRTGKSSRKGEI